MIALEEIEDNIHFSDVLTKNGCVTEDRASSTGDRLHGDLLVRTIDDLLVCVDPQWSADGMCVEDG